MSSSGNNESRKRKSDIDRVEAEYSDDNNEDRDKGDPRHKRITTGKRNNSKQDKKKSKKHERKRSHKANKKRKHHRRRDYDSSSSSSSSSSDDDSESASDTDSQSTSSDESKHRKRKKSRKETKDQPKKHRESSAQLSAQQQLLQVNHATATNIEDKEERHQRRIAARTTLIQSKFGYTADNNPFNDPNLMDTFVWTKKRQQQQQTQLPSSSSKKTSDDSSKVHKKKKVNTIELINEIDKVRERRQNREEQKMEMERMKEEENRLKEYALYDNYQQKEELFHLQQQKLRSALRLINHREKPIDIFAKHILLFGGLSASSTASSDEINLDNTDNNNRSNRNANLFTKYQERYNVLDIAMETLDIEIEEPYVLLRSLKLNELQELLIDIDAYRTLEREAAAVTNTNSTDSNDHTILLKYWDNLYTVTMDEIKYVQSGGHNNINDKDGTSSSTSHAKMIKEISNIFVDQSISDLIKMKNEIYLKLRLHQDTKNGMNMNNNNDNEQYDVRYWTFVYEQIMVYIAKSELSALHQQMLLRQLERLETKKEELQLAAANPVNANDNNDDLIINNNDQSRYSERHDDNIPSFPGNAPTDMFGDLEEELGFTDEVDISTLFLPKQHNNNSSKSNMEDDKYRTRKPRYYNHVKSGFDWSKYNQTHYDKDNPPPKIVLGYKFNIFYPELIDPINQTPSYVLEPVINPSDGTVNKEYCIIRFHAGPPYEDIAFQIVNREWNRSRKRGFKCTFERGILSLYFNFTTHWYRR